MYEKIKVCPHFKIRLTKSNKRGALTFTHPEHLALSLPVFGSLVMIGLLQQLKKEEVIKTAFKSQNQKKKLWFKPEIVPGPANWRGPFSADPPGVRYKFEIRINDHLGYSDTTFCKTIFSRR